MADLGVRPGTSGVIPSRDVAVRGHVAGADRGVQTPSRVVAGPTDRVVADATPRTPAVVASLTTPLPATPVVVTAGADTPVVAPTQTPQARVNEIARGVVERLRAGDPQGALDLVHGQRMREGDRDFEPRVRAAISLAARSAGVDPRFALAGLQGADRTLFDAYLHNPGGQTRPEDMVFLAVNGTGSNVEMVRNVFDDMRTRYPDPAQYQQALANLDRDYVARYGRQRGVTSLEQDLTASYTGQFTGADRNRYFAARAQAPDALAAYQAGEGRTFGHDGDGFLGALERNVGRMPEFANEYGYVADGRQGQDVARLDRAVAGQLSSDEAARARLLTDTSRAPADRVRAYLDATMRAVADGNVPPDAAVRALRNFTQGGTPALTAADMARLDQGALQRAAARSPMLGATIAQVRSTSTATGNDVLTAEVRELLRGGREQYDALASRLRGLSAEERTALQAAIPDFDTQARRSAQVGAGRGTRLDPQRLGALTDAFHGRHIDAGALLAGAAAGRVPAEDALAAVRALPPRERLAFAQTYDAANGQGAFLRDVQKLPAEAQRSLRLATTPLSRDPATLAKVTEQLRDIVGSERSHSGLGAVSTWFTDQFGFSGPQVDDALREVITASRQAAAAGANLNRDQVMRILQAQQRLQSAMTTYTGEQRAIASDAATVASLVVGAATLGAGLSASVLLRTAYAAGAAGLSANAAAGLVQGANYTQEQAMLDFLMYGGGEIAGVGAARLAAPVLRPVTQRVVNAARTAVGR